MPIEVTNIEGHLHLVAKFVQTLTSYNLMFPVSPDVLPGHVL